MARIAAEERAHVAVGVSWFRRVCAALGDGAPAARYRALLAQLAPDLLKGVPPYNHAARAEVGLPRALYDVAAWPPAARAALVLVPHPPHASARPPRLQAAAAAGPGGGSLGGGGAAGLPALPPGQLGALAARLARVLEDEASAAGA